MERPYTFVNVAMTVDGKIDTFERKGAAISSRQDKERVDRLRASADAILVGGHTLIDEDPQLIVKSETLRAERVAHQLSPNPLKVGVATRATFREASKFLDSGPADIVIFTTKRTSKRELEILKRKNIQVFIHSEARVNLTLMMETLKRMGVERLMVEGGGTINFELIRAGLVDEIMIYVSPLVFGGAQAPTLADGLGLPREAAIQLQLVDVEKWDNDGILLKYKL